jgi:hypothetical protein
MDWKWLGGDGAAQVRFRHGEQVASVDDEDGPGGARIPNKPQNHARSSRSSVSCDLLTERVAGSPRTPCPNVNLDELEIKVPVPRLNVAACSINCVNSGRERLLIVIVSLEGMIGFSIAALIIGHLKQTLEVHMHGALMTNYGLRSSLMSFIAFCAASILG